MSQLLFVLYPIEIIVPHRINLYKTSLVTCRVPQIADSMEVMALSMLGPTLTCEWRLQSTQEALITTVSDIVIFRYATSQKITL